MKKSILILTVVTLLLVVACSLVPQQSAAPAAPAPTQGSQASSDGEAAAPAGSGLSADASAIAQARGLSPADVAAALKTYIPSGKHDDYVIFASSGHAGQIFVIGVPSMRLLKTIAVFTPEPWQGYGYGVGNEVLAGGDFNGKELRWADTHHPALSETNGDYDGQFLFINDKANARLAVVDLRDFETKQIIKNPASMIDHGGTFVTPNTEWVVEGGQYAVPLGGEYAPVSEYNEKYRGHATFWKFDREKGRVDVAQSFAIELPPYWQDLCDSGKLVSEGWAFCNSINTERATGGVEEGNPPFEAGVSQADTDYLHIFNIKKAEEVSKSDKMVEMNGFKVMPLQVAIDEGVLYFAPEPKSPHGVDVTPDGKFMVVAGKLDPHVTVYSFEKLMKAIEAKKWDKDEYGVPVLPLDDIKEAQVELGLGPLHTQFDDKGYAYTSLFLDSAVARWTLGGDFADKHPEEPWKLVTKTPVQYNIGHLVTAEGDTVSPDGGYLVAMNKWAIDRFQNVGPLVPQNFQLVDISKTGTDMPVIYDMPIGSGEPHYAQMIKADKLKPWEIYPEIGWSPETQSVDPKAVTKPEDAKIVRDGKNVEVFMAVIRSHYTPEHVEVNQGDHVVWHLTNLERAYDATHGFALSGYNINLSLEPGEAQTIEFDADQSGVFGFYCTEFCSALHLEMTGYFTVKPSGAQASTK
ncbi:MAG: Sec-dependent nitrous-oxide reductase [Anaerolineae bacterium]